jgi:F0F1-type ATP synthase assembly protein I
VLGLLHAFAYDPHPPFGTSPTPFIVMMIMGFVIGVIGHIVRAKGLVAVGIAIVFLATFLLPLLTNVVKSQQ